MECNVAMTPLLLGPDAALPAGFHDLVRDGLRAIDGCVFFRRTFGDERVSEHARVSAIDLTGVECNFNKVHLEYLLPQPRPTGAELARIGLCCARYLLDRLAIAFPALRFRVIVSLDDPMSKYCSLRFHTLRDGEHWYRDIERFEQPVFHIDSETEAHA